MEEKSKVKHKIDLKSVPESTKGKHTGIHCTACGHEASAADMNIQDKIAKCSQCNVVFSFQEEISELVGTTKVAKEEVVRPAGVEIFEFKDELEISIQQPLLVWEILASIFLPVYAVMSTAIAATEGGILWVSGILWILTLGMAFNLSQRKKHYIHVNIDDEYLEVEWRPKKLHKDQKYKISEIDQVYVKKGSTGVCSVHIIVNGVEGQKHVTLFKHLKSHSKARYVEQEIERYLGITDRAVPEES